MISRRISWDPDGGAAGSWDDQDWKLEYCPASPGCPLQHHRGCAAPIPPQENPLQEQMTQLQPLQLRSNTHQGRALSPALSPLGLSQTMTEAGRALEPLATLFLPVAALPGASPLVWLGVPQTHPAAWGSRSLSPFTGVRPASWSSCLLPPPPLSFTGFHKSLAHLIPSWCLPL